MKRSRIRDEMQKTARSLGRLGAIDKRTMRHFDALMLPSVQDLSPREIRALRQRNGMSQAVFAALLNTSISTIQKWEIGEKRPSGPSLKLLDMVRRKGIEVVT